MPAPRSSNLAEASPCSGSDPTLVLGQSADQPLARLRRIDQRVKERGAIAIGQHQRLMFCDRPACGIGQRGHAKIAELAPRQMGGPLDKVLRLFVETESKTFYAIGRLPFDLSLLARHLGRS